MPKKDNESYVEYRKRVMDKISPTFCAAKWYNATLWLTGGKTTSCHHPPAHNVDLDEVKLNPTALHNTFRKRFERQLMLGGKRPKGCDYCWRMEDLGDQKIISDRVFKTEIYSDQELEKLADSDPFDPDFNLRTLEVSFNADCNFACCYCSSEFSSKWIEDVKKHGPYTELVHADNWTINHVGSDYRKYKDDDNNPYINAFWEWWPTLITHLQEFRITGGEPLLSPQLWKVFDRFEQNKKLDNTPEYNVNMEKINFSVNSNLCASDKLIDRLIDKSHYVDNFHLYTSCEAVGKESEYIRDGMNYDKFISNCRKVIEKGNIKSLNMMMTISALCLYSLTDFLDQLVEFKKEYGVQFPVWTVNIVRFPTFMSPLVLPMEIRKERKDHIQKWIDNNKDRLYVTDFEIEGLYRLVEYLDRAEKANLDAPDDVGIMQRDFKLFFIQYSKRRNKDFKKTFSKPFVDWFESVDITDVKI